MHLTVELWQCYQGYIICYVDDDQLCVYTFFFLLPVSVLKHPRAISDYQTADSESLMKRLRPNPHGEEVTN
jgi:hypothetical protein